MQKVCVNALVFQLCWCTFNVSKFYQKHKKSSTQKNNIEYRCSCNYWRRRWKIGSGSSEYPTLNILTSLFCWFQVFSFHCNRDECIQFNQTPDKKNQMKRIEISLKQLIFAHSAWNMLTSCYVYFSSAYDDLNIQFHPVCLHRGDQWNAKHFTTLSSQL